MSSEGGYYLAVGLSNGYAIFVDDQQSVLLSLSNSYTLRGGVSMKQLRVALTHATREYNSS